MTKTPNQKQIELASISYLNLQIISSTKLMPHINDNDKTPSWDGNVEVYNNINQKKENLDGIVPIQVKGKWIDTFSTNPISFSVGITDLINYKNGGGVVFFVILCNYEQRQVYYNTLLPFDIDVILSKKKKDTQKTISIHLNAFPMNEREIYLVFKEYLYHSKRQFQRDENIHNKIITKEIDMLDTSLSLGYGAIPYTDREDTMEYMLTHPTYVYAKPKGFDIEVVLHKLYPESINLEISLPVIVDGECLYDDIVYSTVRDRKHILKIGDNIDIFIEDKKFKIRVASDIKTRIKDLKIMLNIFQNKEIFIGYGPIGEFQDDNSENYDILAEELNFLLEVQKVLDIFSVKKNLIIKNMSADDYQKLNALVRMVLYDEPAKYSFNGNEGIGYINISNLSLLVRCKKAEEEGYYKLYNVFEMSNFEIEGVLSNGDTVRMSPYMHYVKYENLLKADNLNLMEIVRTIISFEHSNNYDAQVNLYALDLIKAYDTTGNIDFLNAAQELFNFLTEGQGNIDVVYLINRLQIKRRCDKLTKEDKMDLIAAKKQYHENPTLLTCVNILLESYEEADLCYDSLTSEEKETFATFPINKIWRKA